jgi:AraC family transcriptional regulator, regulatory protein of adaptative response / methylated-DNA-[protein]-cysteine methyltransferase
MHGSDYSRVAQAIQYLDTHAREHPGLSQVAAHLGLSEFHCQRLFRTWAGVSPKAFLQCLTLERAKALLRESRSLLETSQELGLSGTGRLHDLFLSLEAMTPGEFKRGGGGLRIHWGVHDTPFGAALFGATDRGLCTLSFLGDSDAVDELRERWPGAELVEAPQVTAPLAAEVVSRMGGGAPRPLPLLLVGSRFQVQVWRALLAIPEGALLAYGDLARLVGSPTAARAMGPALATNPIAWLIPCHRVIRATGLLGGYRWGTVRKRAILGVEGARADRQVS